jgi:hypothetical protein
MKLVSCSGLARLARVYVYVRGFDESISISMNRGKVYIQYIYGDVKDMEMTRGMYAFLLFEYFASSPCV